MDPYLEQHWGDVHHRFVTYACDQLQKELPGDLRARVEERVFVEPRARNGRVIVPDVRVVERRRSKAKAAAPTGLGIAEPLVVFADEETTQGFIEIRDASHGHRLVSAIEILSPANKVPGEGQEKYLQKQRELRAAKVSLVEIDLVRAGTRPLPFPQASLPRSYRTPYQVWVRPGWETLRVEVYRVSLRERLPIIAIPLRPTDARVPLDLQTLLDQCYTNGGYEDDLDYRRDPEPPLDRADARWADALLRKRGYRLRRGPRNGRTTRS
jgi:hypothetical protein